MDLNPMKRYILALALLTLPSLAHAQCNGVFPPNTVCGKLTSAGLPGALPNSVLTGVPGGTNQQIQYNNLSNFAGFTMVGDGRLTPSSGTFTLTPSGVTAAAYGNGLNIPQITFDAKGRATLATVVSPTAFTGPLSPAAGSLGAVPGPTAAQSAIGAALGASGGFVGLSRIGLVGLTTPMDHGAQCDGTVNDNAGIQRWLNSLSGYALTGWMPNGRTCRYSGLLSIGSGTRMYLNKGTFKLIDSAGANTGFVCGPTSQLGGPIDGVEIYGGIFDGNRAGQTVSLGGGAVIYCISASNVVIDETVINNGRADGLYIGGSTTAPLTGGRSALVTIRNVKATNNYRNNFSVVGVDRMNIYGGNFNSATNTTRDGPMCGIDFEPDDANSSNTNISVFGAAAASNGIAGLTSSGGSGFCIFGASTDTTNLQLHGIMATNNFHYGIHSYTPIANTQARLHGIAGDGNLSGISLNIRDFFPSGITVDAANSCGAGFRCVGLPN
jgi:hypothetical protein